MCVCVYAWILVYLTYWISSRRRIRVVGKCPIVYQWTAENSVYMLFYTLLLLYVYKNFTGVYVYVYAHANAIVTVGIIMHRSIYTHTYTNIQNIILFDTLYCRHSMTERNTHTHKLKFNCQNLHKERERYTDRINFSYKK